MKVIPLTQGELAIIDDKDYKKISSMKWHAHKSKYSFYARHTTKRINGQQKTLYMHRVILDLPCDKKIDVDHHNHNGLDNRKKNLRICSRSENRQNSKIQENNKSGYKGVYWHKRDHKWRSQIKINQKAKYLGSFTTPEDAYRAYCKSAKQLFGEFANLKYMKGE